MKKKKMSLYAVSFLGSIIILIGILLISYEYILSQKIMAYDHVSKAFYNAKKEEVENLKVEILEEESKEEEEENLPEEVSDDYIGYLNIPKINLVKGFLDYRSEQNDLSQNIMVVEGSKYPNIKNGNLIIAGHSGTAWNSFFDNLYQLEIDDTAYIDYKEKKYNYKLINIYKQEKNGKIAIFRDSNKQTLTLITCTNNDDATQTVYIFELENVE